MKKTLCCLIICLLSFLYVNKLLYSDQAACHITSGFNFEKTKALSEEKLRIEISLNKQQFETKEHIVVHIKVKNLQEKTIKIDELCLIDFIPYFSFQYEDFREAIDPITVFAHRKDPDRFTSLEPNETYERDLTITPEYCNFPQKTGKYRLGMFFLTLRRINGNENKEGVRIKSNIVEFEVVDKNDPLT